MIDKPYNFQIKGRASEVFKMIEILAKTKPIPDDKDWWAVRAYVLANDRNMEARELSIIDRLTGRLN